MQKSTGKEVLRLQSIHHRFGDLHVLNNVDLVVDEGDFIGIAGASGSGKSTLINIMGLMDVPTQGEVWLNGIRRMAMCDEEAAQLRNQTFGFVFQMYHLLDNLTVESNILLPTIYRKSNANTVSIENLGTLLGITPILKKRVKFLSGGEKQRVAIARALINDPMILIADEPTGNLDEGNKSQVLRIFQSLHEQGKTIVLVTHDTAIFEQCPKRFRLKEGSLCETD